MWPSHNSEGKLTNYRKSQNEVDSALLHSSSTLGSGKISTHRERVEKNEDLQVRYAIGSQAGGGKRHLGVLDMDTINVEYDSEDGEGLSRSVMEPSERPEPTPTKLLANEKNLNVPGARGSAEPSVKVTATPAVLGSALRRNEDGTVVAPAVRRKPKKVIPLHVLWEGDLKTTAV